MDIMLVLKATEQVLYILDAIVGMLYNIKPQKNYYFSFRGHSIDIIFILKAIGQLLY